MNKFIFIGRPDGIGNRIEQLINIYEYCQKHNVFCIYIWNNRLLWRYYKPLISFDRIEIKTKKDNNDKYPIKTNGVFLRTKDFIINYSFHFNIEIKEEYDTIIHIRGTYRLTNNLSHGDFSNKVELENIIKKTIDYINNNSDIKSYSIVSDEPKYKQLMKNKINKQYIHLIYNPDIPRDWTDYYYLTKTKKHILMCSKFSSYSITASIIANKKLLVYPCSLNSNLPRYKANIEII